MKLINKQYIYKDQIGFVELWDVSRSCVDRESIVETVATIATLSYGNDAPKDPNALYKFLVDKGHTSVFEFIRTGLSPEQSTIQSSLRNESIKTYVELRAKNIELLRLTTSIEKLCEIHKSNIAMFKLKVPIFVARQIMRHRCASYLEMSRRYVKDSKKPFEFYYKNDDNEFIQSYAIALDNYHNLLSKGYKPEMARSVIPIGAYTIFFMMVDRKCFYNFAQQRIHPHAQFETRIAAETMLKLLQEYQPEFLTGTKYERGK